ncbi:MAG: enoyl-CoA hydratase/isomerase family protein [Actinobacteria bacterium]|nr:enoyl-CoA hydratase/isomerase family protein [Actinomycetota bacterium]
MSDYPSVDGLLATHVGPVLHLRLDRPERRNALTDEMIVALADAVETAGRDEAVRVILLDGAGEHFCSGADLAAKNPEGARRPRVGSIQRRLPTTAHRLIPALCAVQTPVVCRVQGWAAGIGLHLVLAADIAVVAQDARLWEPFSARGFTPDSGGTWLLQRRIGEVRAREMLLLGREVTGAEAAAWGMVHAAVPETTLDAEVEAVVDALAAGPTVALGFTKRLLHAAATADLDAHLRDEALALELSSRSDDFREGIAAFREKRPPRFEGR